MTIRAEQLYNSPLNTHVELLLRLDQLMIDDLGDSIEADALRDIMDISWQQMNPEEQRVARQLSADLFTLHPESQNKHPVDFQIYTKELADQLSSAQVNGDFLRALGLLHSKSSEISAERAALLRGVCYEKLRLIDASLLFHEHAVNISHDRDAATLYFLNKLRQHGRVEEAAARTLSILHERTKAPIEFRILAADLQYDLALEQQGLGRLERLRQAVELYQSALSQLGKDADKPLRWGSAPYCHSRLSVCYMLLGKQERAVQEMSAAIRLNPNDEFLYVQRGLLTTATNFRESINDFQRAVQLGTQEFWAFYYLAYDSLKSERFDACLNMADAALRRTSDLELQSKLHEWIAISIASRNQLLSAKDIETVRIHFKIAMTLAPANQRIMANYQSFESAILDAKSVTNWQMAPIDPLSTSKQSLIHSWETPMLMTAT